MGGNDRRRRVAAVSRPPKGSWEEQLCLSVGKELWRSLTDDSNKECIYLYRSVAGWDDSAAKAAFDNARTRFLAKIKALPCNVPSPDPNAYIDDIDWNSNDDFRNPEVILEEEESGGWRSSSEGGDRQFVLEGLDVLLDPSFGVGWGPGSWHEENEEEVKKEDNQERKAWEAAAPAKVAGGGRGNRGRNKWYNYSLTRRCNRPINGYQWVPKKMYL